MRRRLSRRLLRLAAALCLSALVLPACAQATPLPEATPTPSLTMGATLTAAPTGTISPTQPAPINIDPASLKGINIQFWNGFSGASYEVFTRLLDQFNASNQWGIRVTSNGFGDYTSLFEAVNSSIDPGQTPDLIEALPEQILAWDASGKVVNLAPYLASKWGLSGEAYTNIYSVFLAQDNVNGIQLGFPAERSARFLFYNVTWAHELGFDSPPATPEEFRRQACAANASFLKDSDPSNDGYGGWIIATDWQTSYSWLLAFDGSVIDGNSYTFRTDPNRAALQFLKLLYQDHCAWLPSDPSTFDPFDAFAHRTALFISADLGELPQEAASMKSLKNNDQWSVIPFPGLQKSNIVAYGPSYAVLKSTPEKQLAAWIFTKWLASDNETQWVKATGLFPLRGSTLADLDLQSFLAASPQWSQANKALEAAVDVPQLASWRQVRYVLGDGLTTVFQNNVPLAQLPSILGEMDTLAAELNKK